MFFQLKCPRVAQRAGFTPAQLTLADVESPLRNRKKVMNAGSSHMLQEGQGNFPKTAPAEVLLN